MGNRPWHNNGSISTGACQYAGLVAIIVSSSSVHQECSTRELSLRKKRFLSPPIKSVLRKESNDNQTVRNSLKQLLPLLPNRIKRILYERGYCYE